MTMQPTGNISERAMQMARMFAGEGRGAAPASPMPRGLNMENMVNFAGTPAGQQLMGRIQQTSGAMRQPRRGAMPQRQAPRQQRPQATTPAIRDGHNARPRPSMMNRQRR